MIEEDAPTSISALRADAPPGIDEIINHALAKQKQDRYADVSAMAADLRSIDTAASSSSPSDDAQSKEPRLSQHRPVLTYIYNVAAFLPLVAIILLCWFDWSAVHTWFPNTCGSAIGQSSSDGLEPRDGATGLLAMVLVIVSACFVVDVRGKFFGLAAFLARY